MASRMEGKAKSTSITHMMTRSTAPSKYPATSPSR